MKSLCTLLFLVLSVLASVTASLADEAVTLRISQAVQLDTRPPGVRVYLDILDQDEQRMSWPPIGNLSATLGEDALEGLGLRSLADSEEGVAYIFLVDISRSLSTAEFGQILDALDAWLARLTRRDRVAVLSFGEESRLLVDFTNDFASAQAALSELGPTDGLTVLHEAVEDGLELARRRDPDLPGRRVLVVLTDGRDEGSGLSSEDILDSIRQDPVPIYAIGLSSISDPAARSRYLKFLDRLASNSGGVYVLGEGSNLASAYNTIHTAVRSIWVADFFCPGCRQDGSSRRLQVNLVDDGRVLTDGRQFRLLPAAEMPRVSTSTPVAEPSLEPEHSAPAPAPSSSSTITVLPEQPADDEEGGTIWFWILPILLVAAAVIGFVLFRRSQEDRGFTSAGHYPTTAYSPEIGESETSPEPVTSTAPRPVSLRLVRFVVVRGINPGRQFSLTLMEKGVVGTRSTCDCVLVDEIGVESEQFEIYQFHHDVYIRDLAETRPTLVDGLPIQENHLLKSQALIGTSDFILRVNYDDARPVAL